MVEQSTYPSDEERFGDLYGSPHYQYGAESRLPGDPDNPADFVRAQNYLETITNHLIECGPVWEKQPQAIVEELAYQNAWHKAEVEMEQKRDRTAEYREIDLKYVQALSKRRILALEETGWEVTQAYRVACYIDSLLHRAIEEQEQLEQAIAVAEGRMLPNPADEHMKDVPF